MRLLVCGDHHWTDHRLIIDTLDAIHAVTPIDVLIEGCAPGADVMAGGHAPVYAENNPMYPTIVDPGWAWVRRVAGEHFPAEWKRYGRAAGPIRNSSMLSWGKPDRVLAFHDDIQASRGTANMIAQAHAAGVPCQLVSHRGIEDI